MYICGYFSGCEKITEKPRRIVSGASKLSIDGNLESAVKRRAGAKENPVCSSISGERIQYLLLEAVKGAKPRMIVEPPLIVYKNQNQYTDEIYKIYGMDVKES